MTLGISSCCLLSPHQQHQQPAPAHMRSQHCRTSIIRSSLPPDEDVDMMAGTTEVTQINFLSPVHQHQVTDDDGDTCAGDSGGRHSDWDINDVTFDLRGDTDQFCVWPNGNVKAVYGGGGEEARRHTSGWAMRNTNNHNVAILKKSCLGVLVCTKSCLLPMSAGNHGNKQQQPQRVYVRPAICDKARKKQFGKPCPNPSCDGTLTNVPCRGHAGYPVTHFWRHIDRDLILFQAKGVHDHPMPEMKSAGDTKRRRISALRCQNMSPRKRRSRHKEPVCEDVVYPMTYAITSSDHVTADISALGISLKTMTSRDCTQSPYQNEGSAYFIDVTGCQQQLHVSQEALYGSGDVIMAEHTAELLVQSDLERALQQSADRRAAHPYAQQLVKMIDVTDASAHHYYATTVSDVALPAPYDASGIWCELTTSRPYDDTSKMTSTPSLQLIGSYGTPTYADYTAIDANEMQHKAPPPINTGSSSSPPSGRFPLPEIGEIIPGRQASSGQSMDSAGALLYTDLTPYYASTTNPSTYVDSGMEFTAGNSYASFIYGLPPLQYVSDDVTHYSDSATAPYRLPLSPEGANYVTTPFPLMPLGSSEEYVAPCMVIDTQSEPRPFIGHYSIVNQSYAKSQSPSSSCVTYFEI